MIVAWTGHRPDLFLEPAAARAAVEAAARGLAGQDPASRLPAPEEVFTADWSAADRSSLLDVLAAADETVLADGYSERNTLLVSRAELLVAVWTRTAGGGTAETLDLARSAGIPVREIVLAASPGAAAARGRGI
jgi:hypothetical protein